MVTRRDNSRRRREAGLTLDLSDYDPDGPDFGGGGGAFVIPPGLYPMKVKSCEQKVSKNDSEMLEWIFEGTSGKAKGKTFYFHTVFSDQQKLGKTLEAIGHEFEASDVVDFDPDDAEGAECVGEVYTDEYNGEKRSKLRRVLPEGTEAEEEEEKPTTRGKSRANGKGKKTAVKISEDEVTDMDEDELEELLGKHELEVDLSKAKTLSKKRNAVIEALAENDLIA